MEVPSLLYAKGIAMGAAARASGVCGVPPALIDAVYDELRRFGASVPTAAVRYASDRSRGWLGAGVVGQGREQATGYAE